jgi:asparagine synthase (glutamine-hydrolysing)
MCGICGQLNFAKDEPVNPETIRRMSHSMFHRGPDDEGDFVSGPVGLGFRRLSIIDLAGGRQPMSDAEGTVQVVFNGEIYNFRELRKDLEARGHKFRTRSDTEVIVYGYKQWGTEIFTRLNGMFGIAIWDAKRRRLVVARDAMGIKMIYYRIENGQLTFGSEIRPVLAATDSKPKISPAAVALFLRFRYTPSPLTVFEGVKKLSAGTMLIVENGTCREQRWYDFAPSPFPDKMKDSEAADELLDLYRRSVRRHLCADVPVGVLLSGGLD